MAVGGILVIQYFDAVAGRLSSYPQPGSRKITNISQGQANLGVSAQLIQTLYVIMSYV